MKTETNGKIAVIRIRGLTGIEHKIKKTLDILRLYRKNYCIVIPPTPSYKGMLKKAKDFVTYGEIDSETHKMLVEKKGEEFKGRETDKYKKISYRNFLVFNNKKYKQYFRLNSPKKGFGRKGLKASFKTGGALGYRGDKINELIKRML